MKTTMSKTSNHHFGLMAFSALLLALAGLAGPARAATNVVTSDDDTIAVNGVVTLREAITASNNNAPSGDAVAGEALPIVDEIHFNIPGAGPFFIGVFALLPPITEAVVIDGYTQPGATPNTNHVGAGLNTVLKIAVDGVAPVPGLVIASSGSTIRGLSIRGFDQPNLSGILLSGAGASNNVVEGNFIGTIFGNTPVPNDIGVLISGGRDNTIGGTSPAARNLIMGNRVGVQIFGPSTAVQGNLIGTDFSGTIAQGNLIGLLVAAPDNTVGGTDPDAGNVISGQLGVSVLLTGTGASNNVVAGNFIGTDVTGANALGRNDGLAIIDAASNLIGGTATGSRNLISGNPGYGVVIRSPGASNNVVAGNFIGTDGTGTNALANGDGVTVSNAFQNIIGGIAAGAGNLISGNGADGVRIEDAANHWLQGNFIGTDATGTNALGNGLNGVSILGSPSNTVGGATVGAGNVISGNGQRGVVLTGAGAHHNLVAGNLIGTDVTGAAALGNQSTGVYINDAANNTIGGTDPGARNVISATDDNVGLAILGSDASGNVVAGNYIGTDITGTAALGNDESGVHVGSPRNTIGGTAAGAGNLISGNRGTGVSFGSDSSDNLVQGNLIGTDVTGANPLGNRSGVSSFGVGNTIGGTNQAAANVIAFNDEDGVTVRNDGLNIASSVAVLGNAIFANAGLGIDLHDYDGGVVDEGVTLNDGCDPDAGANEQQNFPVLTSAVVSASSTTIAGTLNSVPGKTYRVEFFANNECDPSGWGEGEQFIGFKNVTIAGPGCEASFTASFPGVMPAGTFVTATATDPDSNTSEFSACREAVVEADVAISKAVVSGQAKPGQILIYTMVVTNRGPGEASSVVVTDPVPQGTTFYSASPAASSAPAVGAGGTVVWSLGKLNSGASATLTLKVKVSLKGNNLIVNTATVSAATPDPNAADNSATVTSKRNTK